MLVAPHHWGGVSREPESPFIGMRAYIQFCCLVFGDECWGDRNGTSELQVELTPPPSAQEWKVVQVTFPDHLKHHILRSNCWHHLASF